MKVEVYWNVRKQMFSVRSKGKVIGHTLTIDLRNAEFVVQQGGRKRVLKEGKKNVHAFVRGEVSNASPKIKWSTARYNPYKHTSFVDAKSGESVIKADIVSLLAVGGKPLTCYWRDA